jgi:hypothetical protein
LVTSWPLPDGTLAGARILSNVSDAPYLGEAAILFNITRQPIPGFPDVFGGAVTAYVYIVLFAYLGAAGLLFLGAWFLIRRRTERPERIVQYEKTQFAAWAALLLAGASLLFLGFWRLSLLSILLTQFLPVTRTTRP